MLLPNRHGSSDKYRYGFMGEEKDDEIKGEGNHIAYAERGYDPRIGRWTSKDSYADLFPSHSPYNYALNNPIYIVDVEGEYPKPSKLLADLGYELPPLAAGILDGAVDQLAGVGGFVYDLIMEPGYANQVYESVKALATDPIGSLGSIANEYIDRLDRLASGEGNDDDYYFIGEELGGAAVGVLLGGSTLAVKYGKKLLTPKVAKGKLGKIKKPGTALSDGFIDGPKIVGGRKTRTPSATNKNINHNKTIKNSDGTTTYTDIGGNTVTYSKNGHPDFSPYSKAEVKINNLTGNSTKDASLANKSLGLKSTPDGFTWHHAPDGKTMQLVPTEVNKNFPHTGGAAIVRDAAAKASGEID